MPQDPQKPQLSGIWKREGDDLAMDIMGLSSTRRGAQLIRALAQLFIMLSAFERTRPYILVVCTHIYDIHGVCANDLYMYIDHVRYGSCMMYIDQV